MKKRRAWITLLVIMMVAVAVGFAMVVREDYAALGETGAAIQEQTAILEEVRAEKRKFAEKLEETAKSLREMPDSTLGSKGRAALDMSFIAGKEQSVLDQKQWRAEKRLAFQMERREAAKKQLTKRGAGFAVTELVLLAAWFALARRAGIKTIA